MSGRYERVNAHDEDDAEFPTNRLPGPTQTIPNSPPPSFHSRASSIAPRERDLRVNSDLADAFDTDGDESDDDTDDRQRLVRGGSSATGGGSTPAASATSRSSPPTRPATQTPATPAPAGSSGQGSGRVYGGGIQSDGVFSNLTAKPERGDGEKEEQPPSYEQAAADAAPPYWETTILAPGLGGPDDVYIDGMPVGSLFSFIWNFMISFAFLVGFLIAYLLHSTHAAKNGALAGLGVTLIQYGFYMKGSPGSGSGSGAGGMGTTTGGDGFATPQDPNSHDFNPNTMDQGDSGNGGISDITGSDWAAYILMIIGWFILIRAVSDYLKARRHEQLVLQSPDRGLGVPIIAVGERSETVV